MIYYATILADWQQQANAATYEAASLRTEGFIHLSETHQLTGVLHRYYQNTPDLLLLYVDPDKLAAELTYEPTTNNELFLHLYGPIDRAAIVEVQPIE